MADHGARFTDARKTLQGKFEERLPFMSFIFPKSFPMKYMKAIDNLKNNVNRLTTPFDIHSTLSSLANMNKVDYEIKNFTKQRNISLFNLIPTQRTCDDLNLEAHWCSCLDWKDIDINADIIQQATNYTINNINQQLLEVKNNLCHQLQLDSIQNAQIHQPNRDLLKFSKIV